MAVWTDAQAPGLLSHIWDEWSVWQQGLQLQCPTQPPSLAQGPGKDYASTPLLTEVSSTQRKGKPVLGVLVRATVFHGLSQLHFLLGLLWKGPPPPPAGFSFGQVTQ